MQHDQLKPCTYCGPEAKWIYPSFWRLRRFLQWIFRAGNPAHHFVVMGEAVNSNWIIVRHLDYTCETIECCPKCGAKLATEDEEDFQF